jgi:hypothetical protein
MAMHILRGEFPIFQWGYNHMGTLESFVAAPIMLIFGPTQFALALSPTLFSMLFACAAYLFAREAAGRATGIWALAFACFPPCFLVWNVVVARGGIQKRSRSARWPPTSPFAPSTQRMQDKSAGA